MDVTQAPKRMLSNDDNNFANDDDHDDGIDNQNITGTEANSTIQSLLGPMLGTTETDVYSTNSVVDELCTLRKLNRRYAEEGGCKSAGNVLPEFDCCATKGCISPMRRFENCVGHIISGATLRMDELEQVVLCAVPTYYDNATDMAASIRTDMHGSVRKGRLWAPAFLGLCAKHKNGRWMYNGEYLHHSLGTSLDLLSISFEAPLSAHSNHAWLESVDYKDCTSAVGIYKQPEETTAVPGFLGTAHNNQLIDLATEQGDEYPDMNKRLQYIDKYDGFLCKMHTPHSSEAGRVRRVCCNVEVRLMTTRLLDVLAIGLEVAHRHDSGPRRWVLWCCGKFLKCTDGFICALKKFLISAASSTMDAATMHINTETHVVSISISSGVLIRRDMNGMIIDSESRHWCNWPDMLNQVVYPDSKVDAAMMFYFSLFFILVPYNIWDRPPRPIVASVQHIQAVGTPYGAGTSSVAPVHVSRPAVTTPLLDQILNNENAGMADILPGEELIVVVINDNDTYEDSIVFNEGSAHRGLYHFLGYSAHVINSTENIPKAGDVIYNSTHRWWKTHDKSNPDRGYVKYENASDAREKRTNIRPSKGARPVSTTPDGRGNVISVNETMSGQKSVKMLRYSQPITGDKISTWHGQKGTIKLRRSEDMPWGVDSNGCTIHPDILISLSSLTNRLTVGQIMELVTGADAIHKGRSCIVSPFARNDDQLDAVFYDGKSGNMLERVRLETGDSIHTNYGRDVPMLVSWGVCRFFQMTQLSEDKQHYTHNTAGSGAVGTSVGRTAGGGLRFSEMDFHASESSGMYSIADEIKSRMDKIDMVFCSRCNTQLATHTCGKMDAFCTVSVPASLIEFDMNTLLTNGHCLQFELS